MPSNEPLFHIAPAAAWAQAADPYVPDGFAAEGFVHCSTQRQVVDVANAFFRGRSDLVLLLIDTARIDAPIRYETANGGRERFPHVYGALPRDSIVAVEPLTARADGGFDSSAAERCLTACRGPAAAPANGRVA